MVIGRWEMTFFKSLYFSVLAHMEPAHVLYVK